MFVSLNRVLYLLHNHSALTSNSTNTSLKACLLRAGHHPRHSYLIESSLQCWRDEMQCHSHLETRKQSSGRLNVLSKVELRITGPSPVLFPLPNTCCPLLVFTHVQKGRLAHCQLGKLLAFHYKWKKKFNPFGDKMTRHISLTGSNSGWACDPEYSTGMATFA